MLVWWLGLRSGLGWVGAGLDLFVWRCSANGLGIVPTGPRKTLTGYGDETE